MLQRAKSDIISTTPTDNTNSGSSSNNDANNQTKPRPNESWKWPVCVFVLGGRRQSEGSGHGRGRERVDASLCCPDDPALTQFVVAIAAGPLGRLVASGNRNAPSQP